MIELYHATFEEPVLPEGWTETRRNWSFERNAIGVKGAAHFHLPLPGTGWGKLRIEVDVESDSGAFVGCGDGFLTLWADLKSGVSRITLYEMAELARQRIPASSGPQRCLVAFEFDENRARLLVEGVETLAESLPGPPLPFRFIELRFWDHCRLHGVRVLGDCPARELFPDHPGRSNEFQLEVCVDFIDDLRIAPWTREMFDQLFAEFKSWGVRRCHWICYGGSKDGWWQSARGTTGQNARITLENVGDIFTQAVRSAHRHGIEIYALLKPFDMGLYHTHGEGTSEAATFGKLRYNGSWIFWIADFAARNRRWTMARKPSAQGLSEGGLFTRIDLVKEDAEAAAFQVGDVRLYVSDDNASYRIYDGPMVREEVIENYPVWEHTASGGRPTEVARSSRIMRLRGLKIPNRYIALSVKSGGNSFANELINLVHVFNENGEERKVTYGLKARPSSWAPAQGATMRVGESDFRATGVEFDVWPGTPSAVFPGFDGIRARWTFDSGEKLLAIGRGKESGTVAALSPSFPEVREWWLSWLKEALEAGADGIELRVRNHHTPLAWGEFGFERPVREEFLKRHGVDLWATDDFDKAAWRRLRGEGYTAFIREAKAVAASFGKPLGLQFSPTLNMAPDQGAAMEIHWDWRAWLEEGLADRVTMKEVWPGTRFADEILSYTRPRGIPVIFCPYANNLWTRPGGEKVVEQWIRRAREHGCNGFQYYECASVITGNADKRISMTQPKLRKRFQNAFVESD